MMRLCTIAVIAFMFAPLSVLAQDGRHITIPIKLRTGARDIPAVVFTPAHGRPAPAVLVLHTGTQTGAHEPEDEDYARALAREGFVAVVPDYGFLGPNRRWNRATQGALRQVALRVSKFPSVAGKPIGTVGFSLGAVGLLAAAVTPQIKAVVVYYGGYDAFAAKGFPRQPATIVPLDDAVTRRITAATLLLHGEKDDEIPASQARAMHEKLQRFGKTSQVVIYPGATHRFDRGAPGGGRQEYTYEKDDKAAADAYARTVAWLKKYLVD